MHTQLAKSLSAVAIVSAVTTRKIETAGFRPDANEEALLLAAEKVTGRKRSDLLRACLKRALAEVVRDMIAGHAQAVAQFEELAGTSVGAGSPMHDDDQGKYGSKHKRSSHSHSHSHSEPHKVK